MWSDRRRGPTALLLAGLLVGLCALYAWRASTYEVGFGACMDDPATHDGRVLALSLWRLESVEPGLYRLGKVARGVPVIGPTDGLEAGDTVSVTGRFDAGRGAVVEASREVHHLRPAKAALGWIGALATLVLARASYRVRGGRLVSRG